MRTKGGGGQIIKMQKQQKKEKELNAQRTKRNSRRAAGGGSERLGRGPHGNHSTNWREIGGGEGDDKHSNGHGEDHSNHGNGHNHARQSRYIVCVWPQNVCGKKVKTKLCMCMYIY